MSRRSRSWGYCSICRKRNPDEDHRCKQSVLNAIDAADSRAWNNSLRPDDAEENLARPTYNDRLRDGFLMLDGQNPRL